MFRLFLLLFLTYSFPQIMALSNTYFGHLGREQGLAQMTIFSIAQDPMGRIWFGTEEGISIYDGAQVHSIKPSANRKADSTYYFRGCEIYNLLATKKGDLFFTADSYLVHYDVEKDRFKQYNEWSASAVSMLRDTLYFVKVRSQTLYRWDNHREKAVPLFYFPVPRILETSIEDDGSIWIGTEKGLYYLPKGSKTLYRIIDQVAVSCFLRTSSGELWIGTLHHGVFRINSQQTSNASLPTVRKEHNITNNRIHALAQNSNGTIWIGAANALVRFDPTSDHIDTYVSDYKQGSLVSSTIRSLLCDQQGRLWVGTASGGVSFMNPSNNSLSFYPFNSDREDSLSGAIVRNIVEDNQGRLWLSTDGGGLNCLDPHTGKVRHFRHPASRKPLPASSLRGIAYDQQSNRVYMASRQSGIFCYDIRTDRFESVPLNCPNRHDINKEEISPLVLHQDHLYFATQSAVYRHSLLTGKTQLIDPINSIEFITFDSKGYLYYLLSNRVYRIHPRNIGQKVPYDEYPLSIFVSFATFLAEDSDQTFIVGTYSDGLMRYNPATKQFSPFLKAPNDRVSDYCYQIDRLNDGNWIITGDRGIALINSQGEVLKTYLPDSRIPLSSLTKQCALYVSKAGIVYIAGVKGVTAMQMTHQTNIATKLYLSNLFVNEQLVHPDDRTQILDRALPFTSSLSFKHDQNNIRLSVASSTLAEYGTSFLYEYKLEGFDQTWVTPNGKEIVYTNIPAGKYCLNVRLKEHTYFGLLPDSSISLPIIVHPVWYRTWWAWTIWIGILGWMIILIIRIVTIRRETNRRILREQEKQEQIKILNEEKLKFFTNISHEFRTPLTLISSQIDLVVNQPDIAPQVLKRLTKTQEQVGYMNRLIGELLDFRKFDFNAVFLYVAQYDLNLLIQTLCKPFQEWAINYHINFELQLPQSPTLSWVDVEQIKKVIINLLSNALKFTPQSGKISVKVTLDSPRFSTITVSNSGVKITDNELEKLFDQFYQVPSLQPLRSNSAGTGLGLSLVRKIVELHGGQISVNLSEKDVISFSVSLPTDRALLEQNAQISFEEPLKPDSPEVIVIDDTSLIDDKLETQATDPENRFSILIVEDNPAILETLTQLFTPFYQIITAVNGEEGYQKCVEFAPHLVVSDVLMPHKNGYELCALIKENFATSHIPVLLLTALSLTEHNLKGLQSGADDYISKPFHAKLLLARVGNLIRSRESLKNRYRISPQETTELLATSSLDKQFLQHAETIVSDHAADETFDVVQFAQLLAVSRTSLFDKFKALIGMTPNEFIRSQKLKLAAHYIDNHPNVPLKAVAEHFAFSSPNYFSKCFRQQFGITPKEYSTRKNNPQE